MVTLPDEQSIPQAQAEALALNELLIKHDIPAEDARTMKPGTEYIKESGSQPYWIITFYDGQDAYLTKVELDAHTGEIISGEDPTKPGDG